MTEATSPEGRAIVYCEGAFNTTNGKTAHGLVRRRKPGPWALYLLIPVAILAGYQAWTHALYGQGLLFSAGAFAADWRSRYRKAFFPVALTSISRSAAARTI